MLKFVFGTQLSVFFSIVRLRETEKTRHHVTVLELIKIPRQALFSECRCTTVDSSGVPTEGATACTPLTGASPRPGAVGPLVHRRGPVAHSLADCFQAYFQIPSDLNSESAARENLYFVVSLLVLMILLSISFLGYCSGLEQTSCSDECSI